MDRSLTERRASEAARLESKLANRTRTPVFDALIAAYTSRINIHKEFIMDGAQGMRREERLHPNLQKELMQLESWIFERKPQGKKRMVLGQEFEDLIGDLFVRTGSSYSETRQMLARMRRGLSRKGAPNKYPQTVKMFDARVANKWSYQQTANAMCDCGAIKHNEGCRERIRKRIKELETFLDKFQISYRNPT
jgi:hypothetical protein